MKHLITICKEIIEHIEDDMQAQNLMDKLMDVESKLFSEPFYKPMILDAIKGFNLTVKNSIFKEASFLENKYDVASDSTMVYNIRIIKSDNERQVEVYSGNYYCKYGTELIPVISVDEDLKNWNYAYRMVLNDILINGLFFTSTITSNFKYKDEQEKFHKRTSTVKS